MVNVIEPKASGDGCRVGIVISRFNEFVNQMMLDGALQALAAGGVADRDITVAWVPGAIEIPIAAQRMAASHRFDVLIAIGCVIRGGTPHFDYVCEHVNNGVGRVALDTGVPIVFGVLTTDTTEQALERADTTQGNKGREFALGALEMVDLLDRLQP